jgi:Carboxypeptidase regulatory-like domain
MKLRRGKKVMSTACFKQGNFAKEATTMVLFVMLLGFTAPIARGQGGRGSVTGTVADTSGAIIPGANVTITNAGTGLVRKTQTAKDGTYVVPLLPVGEYRVTVSRSGFKTVTRTGVVVSADHPSAVDITMPVGSVSTTVQVRANAAMITID